MNFQSSSKQVVSSAAQRQIGAEQLFAVSKVSATPACEMLRSRMLGLATAEAVRRLDSYGRNLVSRARKPTIIEEIWSRAKNPLNALLLTLAAASYFIGDLRAATIIVLMVFLSVATAFIQEHRSNQAAAQLRAMVRTTASVRRADAGGHEDFVEVPIETLVPGDVIRLSAGI